MHKLAGWGAGGWGLIPAHAHGCLRANKEVSLAPKSPLLAGGRFSGDELYVGDSSWLKSAAACPPQGVFTLILVLSRICGVSQSVQPAGQSCSWCWHRLALHEGRAKPGACEPRRHQAARASPAPTPRSAKPEPSTVPGSPDRCF